MKAFIDIGAHKGAAIRRFQASKEFKKDGPWIIHAFEPNPHLPRNYDGCVIHTEAAWIENGMMDFYDGKGKYYGSCGATLIKRKRSGHLDKSDPVRVQTIDLGAWIKQMFRPDDHIILKMDCEGAEYPVLEKMVEDGSIRMVNRLHVEWHRKKVRVSMKRHQRIREKLKHIAGLELKGDYIKSSKIIAGKKRWDDLH